MSHSNRPMTIRRYGGRWRALPIALAMALALTACAAEDEEGGVAAAPDETDAAADTDTDTDTDTATDGGDDSSDDLKEVTFRFDVKASGYVAPFLLAEDKGWYAEEGLTVSFGEGSGSSTTVAVVSEGEDDFGWADFGTMTVSHSQGAQVTSVAVIGQQSPLAVITHPDSGITEPKDIEGKTIGQNPTGATAAIFPAFAAANDIDVEQVATVTAQETSHAQLMARGRTDGFTGWVTFESPAVEEVGLEPVEILWADHGVNVMNVAMITNDELLENDPETVCGFVRASLRAYEYSMENPQEAIDLLLEQYPNTQQDISLKQLEKQFELTTPPSGADQPLGWTAEEDIVNTQEILAQYLDLEEQVEPSELHTNECIPE